MQRTLIDGVEALKGLSGKKLGSSPWHTLDIDQLEGFAKSTGGGAPLEATQGCFALSLVGGLFFEVVETRRIPFIVNYGLSQARFPAPLKVGQRYRLSAAIAETRDAGDWVEAVFDADIEIEGESQPACSATLIYRFRS